MRTLTLTLLLPVLAILAGAAHSGEPVTPEANETPEIRVVENYVPYEEFLSVTGKDPSATVMTLEDYRALVLLAMARGEKKPTPELPPLRAVVADIVYEAVAQEHAVRFDATFRVHIAGPVWVRCPLGAIPSLGSVTIDGAPAWVVTDGGASFLLLKGEGTHSGKLSFSAPLQREEDSQRLSVPLVSAAAGVLNLKVPGRIAPPTAAVPITASYDAASNFTRLSISLGRWESAAPDEASKKAAATPQFTLEWKRGYDSEKNPPLLFAEQSISYLLERASPLFHWKADVTLARRKTDELTFTEPAGLRLVRLAGPGLHSWHRDGTSIRVLLNEPVIGRVQLAGAGVFVAPPGNFELRCFTLNGARQDTRRLTLLEPPGAGLSVSLQRAEGLREISLPAQSANPVLQGRAVRAFLLERPDSLAVVRGVPRENAFESQTAAYLLIDEQRVLLRTAVTLEPVQGRLYRAILNVPAPWKLQGLGERSTARGLRAERISAPGEPAERWQIALENAAQPGAPLELDANFGLDENAWPAGEDWSARIMKASMPAIVGARRSTLHLGLSTHPSVNVAVGEAAAWRTEAPGTLGSLGFPDALLRAGLWTEQPDAELTLALTRKVSRGEYEAVTHVLAQEREAWVRCDVRMTVVDRALEELVVSLPTDAKDPLYILGEDIKEIQPGTPPNERRIRFNQAWLGVRALRIEYRVALAADTDVPVPAVTLKGRFDGRRSVVFQGAGVVELAVSAGPGLQTGALEDVPEFARPFKQGRALFAYTFAPAGQPGTFRIRVFERTPALRNLARDMNLATVLHSAGVSRTHASFVLAYARQQYVQLRLPPDARLLALSVDGQPAQPVQAGTGADVTAIPLPPRSLARIEFVYERANGALGLLGSWSETAPELIDIPVAMTTWKVSYPTDYDASLRGGNLIPDAPREAPYFLHTFAGSLLSGRLPRWTAWETAHLPALESLQFTNSAQTKAREPVAQSVQQLHAVETQADGSRSQERALGSLGLSEGAALSSSKVGGNAVLRVAYTSRQWQKFAPRTVFLLTLAAGVALWVRRSLRTAATLVLAGLLLGTLLPIALDWHSTLLLIPLCEGLSALGLLLLAASVAQALQHRRVLRSAGAGAAVLLIYSTAHGAETLKPVLIPYEKSQVTSPDADPKQSRVYVPESVFKALVARAYPEKNPQDEKIDAPLIPTGNAKAALPYAFGDASYELTVSGETYTLRGTVQLATFREKDWAAIPLSAGSSFMSGLTLNGQPVTVGVENGLPFVQIFGAGRHVLGVEVRGPVRTTPGRAALAAQLLPGAATRVKALLPGDVELDPRGSPAAWVTRDAAQNRLICEFDLGSRAGAFNLAWQSPGIKGKGASQLSTKSYSHLRLGADGVALARFEHVTLNGAALDQLTFSLLGDWDIASVSATDLAAWAVSGDGATRVLQLWYQKPVNATLIEIGGWAPLNSNAEAPLPTLSLQNALRQEGYIGLEHGAERRFTAASPTELKRSSLEELSRSFTLPESVKPDRIYHWYELPQASRIAAEDETNPYVLETNLTGVVLPHVLQIFARSRYTTGSRLPLRHEIELPPGWEIRSVRGGNIRRWDVPQEGATRRLSIEFASREAKSFEILWSAEAPFLSPAAGAAVTLSLPLVRTAANAPGGVRINETTDWVLAADESLVLSQNAGTTLLPVPIDRAPAWVKLPPRAGYRIAFRSSKPDARLSVDVLRQNSAATATVVSFIRAADEFVQVNTRILYRIDRAGMERFTLRLPPGAALLSLDARNLRSSSVTALDGAQGSRVLVELQAPAIGEQAIDLAYRFPRNAAEGVTVLPIALDDANIRTPEHFAGLLHLDRGLVLSGERKGLLELKDREEVPFLPRGVSTASLAEAFVAEPDWSFTLRQPEVVVDAGPSAQVALAVLKTVIANDGGVRNAARYRVRNRSLQFIRIALPLDAKLWGISVDGQPSSISSSSGTGGETILQIPIPRMSLTDLPSEILIVYESAPLKLPAALAGYSPRAPRVLDMTPVETYWEVYVPDDYETSRSGGNVQDVAGSVVVSGALKTSIAEGERLVKLIENPETPSYQRQRALRNIARNRQELSDNVTVLNETGQNINAEDLRRVGNEEWKAQRFGNTAVQQQAATLQDRVGKYGKAIEEAVAGAADPRQQQILFDNYSFLSNQWRDGVKARKPGVTAEPARGDVDARELAGAQSLKGFKSSDLPAARTAKPQQQTETPANQQGLRDESALFVADATPADLRLVERGTKLTFRRVEGHPELELSLRSRDASWRYGAWAMLLGIAAVAGFARYKRRKA